MYMYVCMYVDKKRTEMEELGDDTQHWYGKKCVFVCPADRKNSFLPRRAESHRAVLVLQGQK